MTTYAGENGRWVLAHNPRLPETTSGSPASPPDTARRQRTPGRRGDRLRPLRAGLPTVYVSGDNASLDPVRAIAEQLGPFDVALLSTGVAQTALLEGAFVTLTSELAAQAARILGAPQTMPLHLEGWADYT